jgi:hypothetical protein
VEEDDGKRALVIESGGEWKENAQLKARIISRDSEVQELNLRQIAPKRYTASLEGLKAGPYEIDFARVEGNGVVSRMTKGVLVPPEGKTIAVEDVTRGNNVGLLKLIAQRTNGEFNPDIETITLNTEIILLTEDLSKWLIPIAMGLLLADIAVRRIGIV